MMPDLRPRLARLLRLGLARTPRPRRTPAGVRLSFGTGKALVNFCGNDYLGLAAHPAVLEAARVGIFRWGWGSAASRLVTGTTEAHARLERALAGFHGRPAALLFGTGYQANVGALSALIEKDDLVFSDALNHASLIDGCRLSGAEIRIYRHADLAHLDGLLKRVRRRRRLWIITDAVFSVDGDLAPLEGIAELAERRGAATFVDEAHAIGVFGAQGRGRVAALGLEGRIDVVVGTLSKALGGVGGWVSGSRDLVALLRSTSRALMFTTAPPPAAAEAALAALRICRGPEGDRLRARLWTRARILQEGLGRPGQSPITAISYRGVATAGRVSKRLEAKGFYVAALRPPTVPAGTSRLRISPSASHTLRQVGGLLTVLRTGSSSGSSRRGSSSPSPYGGA
jgi:8-amino-7-oxononanoate synthase